jgi:hypothetical protein
VNKEAVRGARVRATSLEEPFNRSPDVRQRIITGVCDRLVGDLDSSLRAVRKLCSSLDSCSGRETEATDPANG